jgi:hypothetical protein
MPMIESEVGSLHWHPKCLYKVHLRRRKKAQNLFSCNYVCRSVLVLSLPHHVPASFMFVVHLFVLVFLSFLIFFIWCEKSTYEKISGNIDVTYKRNNFHVFYTTAKFITAFFYVWFLTLMVPMGWACSSDEEGSSDVEFCWETSWKAITWTYSRLKDNIKIDLRAGLWGRMNRFSIMSNGELCY